jgi:enamine deaminase RidA (YjgF/YER057c/UK114 family)
MFPSWQVKNRTDLACENLAPKQPRQRGNEQLEVALLMSMQQTRFNPRSVWSHGDFPSNQAVLEPVGQRVHFSGQVAWAPDGTVVGIGDPEAQTECAIDNIEAILSSLGGSLADVVSLTMYFVRDQDFEAIQSVRRRRFKKATGPATTGIKVAGIPFPDLLVEITAFAVIPDPQTSAA